MATRNLYSKEFKLDAISLVLEQGYSRAHAARSLEINPDMAVRWIKEHESALPKPVKSQHTIFEVSFLRSRQPR